MDRPKMEAILREETGSASARRLRRTEMIPAIVYGRKKGPRAISVKLADIMKIAHGSAIANMIFNLAIGSGDKGKSETVIVKDVQHDPVTGGLLHIDFNMVSLHEKVSVEVPIEEAGEAVGVTQHGGVLEHLLRSLKVECLPGDIPERITVDVASLQIGDNLYVKDISPPPGVTIIEDMELPIFSVTSPRVEEEVVAAPEEEAVEAAPEEAAEEAEEKEKEKVEEEVEKKKKE